MPQFLGYTKEGYFFDERDKLILDFIAEHPGCTRKDISSGTGIPYSTVRYRCRKYELMGWIISKLIRRVYHYWIKRSRRMVVTSFVFTEEVAKRVEKEENYRTPVETERHIEVVVEVDKPDVIYLEPEYVMAVFLDYSAWAFSIGTPRGRRAKPDKTVWPARYFWLPEFIKKEQRRIRIKMKERLPEANIHVGSTDVMPSEYSRGEYFVRITYTDYDYPNNSFTEEKKFADALHKFKEGKFKYELVGWIIDVDNRNFKWGTPAWFKKKYGGGIKV